MNEILTTSDGSHTLKSDKFDATYHSIHGAIDESNVVFINAGLKQIVEKKPKNISREIAFILAKIGDLFGEKFPFNTDKFLKISHQEFIFLLFLPLKFFKYPFNLMYFI